MQPVKSAGERTHILLTVELTHKSYILSRRLNLDFKSIDFSRGWDYWPNEKRCIPFLSSFFLKIVTILYTSLEDGKAKFFNHHTFFMLNFKYK